MEPSWIFNSGVLLALSKHIKGWDWHSLCCTCKKLRPLSGLNRELSGTLWAVRAIDAAGAITFPAGITHVNVPVMHPTIIPVFPDTVESLSVQEAVDVTRWTFPKGLSELILWGNVNLDTIHLPEGLKTLNARRSVLLTTVLPQTLTSLSISLYHSFQNIKFPESLSALTLRLDVPENDNLRRAKPPFPVLPSHLKRLTIFANLHYERYTFPDALEDLEYIFTGYTVERLNNWTFPKGLRMLSLNGPFVKDSKVTFPAGLKELHLRGSIEFYGGSTLAEDWKIPVGLEVLDVNFSVVGWQVPDGLKSLIHYELSAPLDGWTLPDSLEILDMGRNFNSPVEEWVLPKSLKILNLGMKFDQRVERWRLPEGLTTISFGGTFRTCHKLCKFPSSLRTLTLPKVWAGYPVGSDCFVNYV